jgi:hypothetical protein
VPAGRVIIFGDAVQPELAVEERADELGRIDDSALERRENVAGREQSRIDAELAVDAARQTRNAHLEPAEVLDLLDRLAEPAGHLHAGVPAQKWHEIEPVIDLAPELDAAAVIDPAVEALEVEAEGNGSEVLRGKALPGPEV